MLQEGGRFAKLQELLSRLLEQRKAWKRRRWYALSAGVFNAVIGLMALGYVLETTTGAPEWNAYVVWICPLCWWMFIQGVWIFTSTILRWKGDPTELILLEMLSCQTELLGVQESAQPAQEKNDRAVPALGTRGF